MVAVGPFAGDAGRVVAFDRNGKGPAATSADLPITFVRPLQGDVDCGPSGIPRPPIVANDGTVFVYSEVDDAVLALNPFLAVRDRWPFHPATGLEIRYYEDPRSEISCGSLARPTVGPDRTLYMPLQARDDSVGGNVVAVGPDGQVRSGWPVELRRSGAEFWSVVVGGDGTVYALALEPESGNAWSSSIVAIAPDSTVRYTTTIVEP
jgi:outer membrane protein assembly factor BamB